MTTMTDVPDTRITGEAPPAETRPVFGDPGWIAKAGAWGHQMERVWGDDLWTLAGLDAVATALTDAEVEHDRAETQLATARRQVGAGGDLFDRLADQQRQIVDDAREEIRYLEELYADVEAALEDDSVGAEWLWPPYGSRLAPMLDDPYAPWPNPACGASLRENER